MMDLRNLCCRAAEGRMHTIHRYRPLCEILYRFGFLNIPFRKLSIASHLVTEKLPRTIACQPWHNLS
jgi:hypothetical protein